MINELEDFDRISVHHCDREWFDAMGVRPAMPVLFWGSQPNHRGVSIVDAEAFVERMQEAIAFAKAKRDELEAGL